jgi:hypothetical protein
MASEPHAKSPSLRTSAPQGRAACQRRSERT